MHSLVFTKLPSMVSMEGNNCILQSSTNNKPGLVS